MLTFAIGDIHGMSRKLSSLIEQCRTFAGEQAHRFVLLGDYIDRGDDSKGVVDIILRLRACDTDPVLLRGNHEQMLIDAAETPEAEMFWLQNGGAETLKSYGVANAFDVPGAHLALFRSLPFMYDDGLRLFVHAGINPSRSLARQKTKYLLWAREPFLSSKRDFGRLIVHGHTPTATGGPELLPNRLNIDTGAVYGGPLTAAAFNNTDRAPVAFIRSERG